MGGGTERNSRAGEDIRTGVQCVESDIKCVRGIQIGGLSKRKATTLMRAG